MAGGGGVCCGVRGRAPHTTRPAHNAGPWRELLAAGMLVDAWVGCPATACLMARAWSGRPFRGASERGGGAAAAARLAGAALPRWLLRWPAGCCGEDTRGECIRVPALETGEAGPAGAGGRAGPPARRTPACPAPTSQPIPNP